MTINTIKISSAGLAVILTTTGCSNMTPEQNAGVWGVVGGTVVGGLASAAGMKPGAAIATGAAAGAIIAVTAYVISKHQATERQRQIAEERAEEAFARMPARQKDSMARKKVRYVAVATEKSPNASPKTKQSVMIVDAQSKKVVDNEVYDVENSLPADETVKIEDKTVEYVGTGR